MSLLKKGIRKLHGSYCRTLTSGRKLGVRTLYSLPVISKRDPRTKLVTFRSHCREVGSFSSDASAEAGDCYLRIRPHETIRRLPPISLDERQAAQFHASALRYQGGIEFTIPEVFLARLHQAKISAHGCIVLSRDNDIFIESALSNPEILEANGVLDAVFEPRCVPTAGTYCLLGSPWAAGYYHWLFEILPRLSLIEGVVPLNTAPLIVSHQLSSFQRESLTLLGVIDRIAVLEHPHQQIETLYFPEVLAPTGNPSPHAVAWLRAHLMSRVVLAPAKSRRRIYLTRRDATQRRLLNEAEIVDFLQSEGFEIVCPGDLSLAEQITLFQGVDVVVAPHGAGLSNMVFAPLGATLVEFFGTNYINGCYWALANICGHRHAFLTGEPTALDYIIPLRDVKRLLYRLKLS